MRWVWVVLAIVLWAWPVLAFDETLQWDLPTTNEDGTPLTDLAGTRVYVALAPIADDAVVADMLVTADVPAPETDHVLVLALPPVEGTVYARAKAYDENGNESIFSNQVAVPFDKLPPNAAGQLRIIGQ